MRIAYLIATHRNPRLLTRVIDHLTDDDSTCFVHVDAKADLAAFPTGAPHVVMTRRLDVVWGEFSQVLATLELMRTALAGPVEYDYFVFLQGSDYPLRSRRRIRQFFEEQAGHEFINTVRIPAPGFPLTKIATRRYPSSAPVRRLVFRALAKFGLADRDYTRYLPGMAAYGGNAHWALSRAACRYIVDRVDGEPAISAFFEQTFTPDEMFFHTLLGNSPFASRCRRSVVFVEHTGTGNWSGNEGGRHLITDAHLARFAASERVWVEDEWGAGEVLFARKFSDDDLAMVDRVDAMIASTDGRLSTFTTR